MSFEVTESGQKLARVPKILLRHVVVHDGLHLVRVANDVIHIQKGNLEAPLRRIVKARMHPGDWKVMLVTLEKIREMHSQKGKSKPMR